MNLYNWFKVHNHPNKKRIDGIKKIDKPKIISKIKNRSIIRGIEFHLVVDPKEFEHGEGDINLFGAILNKFLSQYVTINSFIQLKITEIRNKQRIYMGTDTRKNSSSIIDDLVKNGPEYNVWQATRIADSYVKKLFPKETTQFLNRAV